VGNNFFVIFAVLELQVFTFILYLQFYYIFLAVFYIYFNHNNMYTVKIICDSLTRGVGPVKTLIYLATYNVNISHLTTIISYLCNCLTSEVHLLMIVWCLMFSAWRESTMLKLAQVTNCV